LHGFAHLELIAKIQVEPEHKERLVAEFKDLKHRGDAVDYILKRSMLRRRVLSFGEKCVEVLKFRYE